MMFLENRIKDNLFKPGILEKIYQKSSMFFIEYKYEEDFKEICIDDLDEFAQFLQDTIEGLDVKDLNLTLLRRLSRVMHEKFTSLIDHANKRFDKPQELKVAEFIITQVITIMLQIQSLQQTDQMLSCHTVVYPTDEVVSINYSREDSSALVLTERGATDLEDFMDFYQHCFPDINFSTLTFGYAENFCKTLYQTALYHYMVKQESLQKSLLNSPVGR